MPDDFAGINFTRPKGLELDLSSNFSSREGDPGGTQKYPEEFSIVVVVEVENWTATLEHRTRKLDVEGEKGLKFLLLWQFLHGVPDSSNLGGDKLPRCLQTKKNYITAEVKRAFFLSSRNGQMKM